MTQADVLKVMEKYPDKSFTTEDLRKILKYNSVRENLRKLYFQGLVEREINREDGSRKKEYFYRLKGVSL